MTAVNDAVNALVTTFRPALPAWQILDGWNGHDELAKQVLVIAWTPTQGAQAITSTVDPEDGGLCDLVETITISCSAAAWDGNLEFASKRAEVAAMLKTIRSTLAQDPKLGGFALDAYLAPTVQWYTDVQPATQESAARANVEVDMQITVEVHAP